MLFKTFCVSIADTELPIILDLVWTWDVRAKQRYTHIDLLTFSTSFLVKPYKSEIIHCVRLLGGRPTCSSSPRTKISIFSYIKPIPIHPYFVCFGTIIITNTVACTFNVRISNLLKSIFMWQRNTWMMQYYLYMKIHIQSINTTYMQILMVKSSHEIPSVRSTKYCKI